MLMKVGKFHEVIVGLFGFLLVIEVLVLACYTRGLLGSTECYILSTVVFISCKLKTLSEPFYQLKFNHCSYL